MQLKIAKILNTLLIAITLVILALGAGYFYIYKNLPQYKTPYLVGFVAVALLLMWLFRYLESGWDKRVITRMAREGKIAIASIKGAERVMRMRDSSFANYWLYSFTGILLTPELEVLEDVTFYEKMSAETQNIPQGAVFVTYDGSKPGQIFIIPNVLISHLPELMPAVQRMEGSKKLAVKYLNAYYNKGIVIKTFKETIAEQQYAAEHKRLQAERKKREKEGGR